MRKKRTERKDLGKEGRELDIQVRKEKRQEIRDMKTKIKKKR